jgi:anti-anti-sigma factor
MKLTQHTYDGRVSVAIEGELDAASAPELEALLVEVTEADDGRSTTLDLAGCTFIDSTGLRVIIEAGQLLDQRRWPLRIVNLQDQPKDLFELTMVGDAAFIEIDDG